MPIIVPNSGLVQGPRNVRRGIESMRRMSWPNVFSYDVLMRFFDLDFTCASSRYFMAGNRLLGPFAANVLAQALIGGRRFGGAEEARENIALHNTALDNVVWTKDRASVSADAWAAPKSGELADVLVPNTDDNTHPAYQSISFDGSSSYAYSGFFKQMSFINSVRLLLSASAFPGTPRATFSLVDGTINGELGDCDSYGSVQLVNGWWFLYITATSDVATTSSANIYPADDGDVTFPGDDTNGIGIYGVQVEKGAFPSSLIKTGASPVTRAKTECYFDAADVSGDIFYDGKFACDLIPFFDHTDSSLKVVYGLDENPKYIQLHWDGPAQRFSLYYWPGPVARVQSNVLTFDYGQKLTIIIDAAEGSIEIIGATSGNGKVVGTPWDGHITSSNLYWGNQQDFNNQINGILSEPYRVAA